MAVDVEVRGMAELRHVAHLMRGEAKALRSELREALKRATEGYRDSVVENLPSHVPTNYANVLGPALRVTPSVRLSRDAGVRLRVWARGKRNERDVAAVDRGVLRHPVFGHRSRWVAQGVLKGAMSAPFSQLRPKAVDEINDVLEEIRVRVEVG